MKKTNFILLPLTFVAIGFIYFYKFCISPYFPKVCRFTPSCSSYALEAVKHYGVFKGSFFALKRILKCHPFHKGGFDPLIK